MSKRELEERITYLEDVEAIKQLMAEYCDIADEDHNADRIVGIFTEDGVWDGGEDGVARGHDELRALFDRFRAEISFSQHNVFNHRIRVDGNTAHHDCNFFGAFTFRESNARCWLLARSVDLCVKVDGQWKLKHHKGYGMAYPFEEGWPLDDPAEGFANQQWRGP
ncbi:nuclear transport factor 2 family protein [Pseudohaliea sp.]|uniref:nuclear transport factor 2 family protein n=1 Tax=Pseudohaliea sp. TaxID=2740289 RepID=UPI0032EDFBB1